jgi:hypothetical protein
MASTAVVVRLELVEAPELGVWCGSCALPSAVRAVGALIIGRGCRGLITVEACTECGAERVL